MTLSGVSNTYTGSTTVSGTSSRLTIYAPFNTSSILNNGALSIGTASPFIYAGQISGPGTLTKAGASQLTLTGPNNYSGGTTITAGTLQAGNASALGTGSVAVNSTLDLNGQSLTIGNLSGASGLITSNSASTSSMLITSGTSAGNSTTVSSYIQDGASSATVGLTMNGPGLLTLSDINNNYSGGNTIGGGTLQMGGANTLGSGNLALSGATGVLDLNGQNLTVNYLSGVAGSIITSSFQRHDQHVDHCGDQCEQFYDLRRRHPERERHIRGPDHERPRPVGPHRGNTYSGSTTISGGTLSIGNGGSTGSLNNSTIQDNSVLMFNNNGTVTYNGAIGGSGQLVQQGSGNLILTANQGYSGVTTISGGTLTIGNGGTPCQAWAPRQSTTTPRCCSTTATPVGRRPPIACLSAAPAS